MEINEILKALREDHDLKQKQIAEITGVSEKQVSRWEQGTSEMGIYKLKALCEYLEISADYILGLEKGLTWPRDFKKGGKTKQTHNSAKSIFLFSIRTSWALRAMDVLLSLQTTFLESLTENRYRDKIGVPLAAVLLFL